MQKKNYRIVASALCIMLVTFCLLQQTLRSKHGPYGSWYQKNPPLKIAHFVGRLGSFSYRYLGHDPLSKLHYLTGW